MITLTERITQDGITATVEYRDSGAPSYTSGMDDMHWWDVTMQYDGRQVTIPFGMGTGHHGAAPTAQDVLSSVLSDAAGYYNARSFEEWAGEYGYSEDSRRALATYEAVREQAVQLHDFLGDKYDAYLWETEND